MTGLNLCDYSDAYLHVQGTITVANTGTAATPDNGKKNVIFKNCAQMINFNSEINNTQVDDA